MIWSVGDKLLGKIYELEDRLIERYNRTIKDRTPQPPGTRDVIKGIALIRHLKYIVKDAQFKAYLVVEGSKIMASPIYARDHIEMAFVEGRLRRMIPKISKNPFLQGFSSSIYALENDINTMRHWLMKDPSLVLNNC
jgi:hypothetical protein